MRMLILFIAVITLPQISLGQLLVTGNQSRLIVPDHMEFVVDAPELIIDTLIMDKHSTLKFAQPYTRVIVRHAMIGSNCKWIGRGMPAYEGLSMNGASLDIEIVFKELGQLTIDVSGGMGYTGHPGRAGAPGANGQILSDGSPGGTGGPGGNGGQGGNITFKYRTLGDPVVFERAKRNSVLIKVDGGEGGPGGMGGPGGPGGRPTGRQYEAFGTKVAERNGQNGQPGPRGNRGVAGNEGNPGVLKIIKLQ